MISWHKSIFRGQPWYTAVDRENGIRLEMFQGGPEQKWFTHITTRPEEGGDFPLFKGNDSMREGMEELVEKLDQKIKAYTAMRDAVKERLGRNADT